MSDPTLYLYTSLTAGSSHIFTATARLESILKGNRIPFRAIDVATDDKARQLWGRRSKGRKLPGLVKFGAIVGDLDQIEEWNEYGELRMQIDSIQDFEGFISNTSTSTPSTSTPSNVTSTATAIAAENAPPKPSTIKIQSPPPKSERKDDQISLALRQAGADAASKAKESTRAKAGLGSTAVTKKDTESQSQSTTVQPSADSEKKEDQSGGSSTKRRGSVNPAPELERPSLASEAAAQSSANFRAENAETLGLVGHHRGSIVSATSADEQAKVASDIRKSISEDPSATVESMKAEHGIKKMQCEAKKELKSTTEPADSKQAESSSEAVSQKQDPKDNGKASTTMED
ncbi:Dentin matrix acidic phosphoprotein 1 [Monascus purpureus]|uniref:Dentin matrix acidic phosphoprotein 1 n=1 Tax=Monascus purpureus TaxID=5098 RepID=A0A507QUL3_MONPU|nr:Dentin matrix acidic phosphoprotein 1 [Monascus purpureus]